MIRTDGRDRFLPGGLITVSDLKCFVRPLAPLRFFLSLIRNLILFFGLSHFVGGDGQTRIGRDFGPPSGKSYSAYVGTVHFAFYMVEEGSYKWNLLEDNQNSVVSSISGLCFIRSVDTLTCRCGSRRDTPHIYRRPAAIATDRIGCTRALPVDLLSSLTTINQLNLLANMCHHTSKNIESKF